MNGTDTPEAPSQSSQVRKVLVEAQRDLDNADLLFPQVTDPLRKLLWQPALSIATEIVPPIAKIVPFGDEVTAFSLAVPFNVLRFGYSVLHKNQDGNLSTILQDAQTEFCTLVNKWESEMDRAQKVDIIGWRGYFIATTVELLSDPMARLSEWKYSFDSLSAFLEETGLGEEYRIAKASPRFDNNLRIIGNVQAIHSSLIARREATAFDSESVSRFPETNVKLAAKLMRYSTAAFGKDTMEAQEVYSGKEISLFDSNALPFDAELKLNKDAVQLGSESLKRKVCEHVGIPLSYIRYFYLGYGGDMKLLRHFIAIDDDIEAVVFVIRGTQSHSGWNIDAKGMAMPFCHGVAHAGIGTMAHALMAHSKGEVLKALAERPNYPLIITGHSLGSGMACLVNILCHADGDIGQHEIECHAFGGPPVYLKSQDNADVDRAIANSVVYVHGEDCVPHISMYNCQRLLHTIAAVDTITEQMSEINQDLIGGGRKMPSAALVEAVRSGDANLRVIEGAPRLTLPASRIVWFRNAGDYAEADTKYNMMLCDPAKFSELGFYVSQDMFSAHPPPGYETALNEVEKIGWDVLNEETRET